MIPGHLLLYRWNTVFMWFPVDSGLPYSWEHTEKDTNLKPLGPNAGMSILQLVKLRWKMLFEGSVIGTSELAACVYGHTHRQVRSTIFTRWVEKASSKLFLAARSWLVLIFVFLCSCTWDGLESKGKPSWHQRTLCLKKELINPHLVKKVLEWTKIIKRRALAVTSGRATWKGNPRWCFRTPWLRTEARVHLPVKKVLKRTTMLKGRVLVVTSWRLELKDNPSPHWRTSHLQTEAAVHFAMKKLLKRMRISQGRVLKATHCSIGTQKIPLQ